MTFRWSAQPLDFTEGEGHSARGRLPRVQRLGLNRGGSSRASTYTLEGDTLTIRWSAEPQDFTTAKVTVLADGSLEFSDWVEGMAEPKFLLLDQVTLRNWKRVS